jgi:hypothetical protein
MRPLIDPMEANYSLACATCKDEDRDLGHAGGPGDLSDGGTNLTKQQANSRASHHLRRYPLHELDWSAIGAARRRT